MEVTDSDLYPLALRLLAETEHLRSLIFALIGSDERAFEIPSVGVPRLQPAELGFIRMVSWLFVLYFETARVSVKFLTGKISVYGADRTTELSGHSRVVRCLRTSLQHHLELKSPDDAETRELCFEWYKKNCGTAVPDADGHWKGCLIAIIQQAVAFVSVLAGVARNIEKDDSRELICSQWRSRVNRYRTPLDCERLVSQIAGDMGRDHLDAGLLTKRNHQKWMSALELISSEAEIDQALRRLVETTLLTETISVLPLSGDDIMAEFGISPGKRVGDLLKIARKLYDEKPSARDELLSQLAEFARR